MEYPLGQFGLVVQVAFPCNFVPTLGILAVGGRVRKRESTLSSSQNTSVLL